MSIIIYLLTSILACGNKETTAEPSSDDTAEVEDTADVEEASFLTEAFSCTPDLDGSGVASGSDLMKVTLNSENALCNDGSPAVMFVRRAATVADEQNWVFHLQGGGGCGGSDCEKRWCERNEKMTSVRAPEGMLEKGILTRGPQNELGNANQVYVYYCSSDNWAGTQQNVEVDAVDEIPAFRIHFNGKGILEEVFSVLEAGAVSDGGEETLPPLVGGGWALWTGTSGGCQGVMNTADRTAEYLRSLGVSPWIVCDANYSPTTLDLPAGEALDTYVAQRKLRFEINQQYAQPAFDQSCLDAHPEEEEYLCDWTGYGLRNHIVEAPLFVRMSLADNTISKAYIDAGFTMEEFALGVRSLMLRSSSEDGNEAPERPIAVYGPGCTQHVGLTDNEWFFETLIYVNENPVSFHDAVVAWMGGMDVAVVDTVPPTNSVCGEATDDTD